MNRFPPGLDGYMAVRQQQGQEQARQIQGLTGLAALQDHMEKRSQAQALREQTAQLGPNASLADLAQAAFRAGDIKTGAALMEKATAQQLHTAQLGKLNREGAQAEQQQGAKVALAQLMSTGGYQGNAENPVVSPPTGVMMNDEAAIAEARAAMARGGSASINVPNPGNVRGLGVLSGLPQGGLTELLKQTAPGGQDKPYTLGPGAIRMGPNNQPVANAPFAPRVDTTDRPLTDVAKLNADRASGRITEEQFEAASKTKLGAQSVIPDEHSTLTGEAYLATLPVGIRNAVKSVVEGKIPITSFSIRNNQRDAMIQRATQYDPTFEAGKAPARMAVQKDFTSGVAARNVTAINTAIRHMGTLDELGIALANKDVQVVNAAVNKVRAQFGDPRVNNFDTAKSAVGNELMRVFRQVGASEVETKDWESKFSASQSPAQMKGAIKTGVELLQGRIHALDEQWMRGMDTDKGYPQLLTPVAKDILGRIGGNPKRRESDAIPTGQVVAPYADPDKQRRYDEWRKANP